MVSTVVLLCCFSSVIYTVASQINQTKNFNSGDHRCKQPFCFYFGAELLMGLDTSVDPCDNFYNFVCGRWEKYYFPDTASVKDTKIDEINRRIRALLEGPVYKEDEPLLNAQKFYNHCVDASKDELIQTVLQELDELGGLPILKGATWDYADPKKNFEDLFPLIAKLRRKNFVGGLFQISVEPKNTDNSKMIIELAQPPHYLQIEDTKFTEQEYIISYLQQLIPELNGKIVMEEISHVLELRNSIKENLQDFNISEIAKEYYITTVEEFTNVTKMDWLKLLNLILEGIHIVKPEDEIQVRGINYFKNLRNFADNSSYSPRNAMNYELLYYYIAYLYDVIHDSDKLNINVRSQVKCVDLVKKSCYNLVLSAKYESTYLHTGELGDTVGLMTAKLFEVYDDYLMEIDWLDNVSRNAAQEKLKAMKGYYLYPTWTMNKTLLNEYYKDLEMKENLMQDTIECHKFLTMDNFHFLKQRPKLRRWNHSPLQVNAYYIMEENAYEILAGIMHYPFFNEDLLQVMYYGALGSVIGQQITHAFDTIGIQYDKYGNFKPWLTANAESAYQKRTQCLVNQYSSYEFTADELPGTKGYKVNGMNTLDENIADNGGIRQAFKAYKKWAEEFGEEILPDSLRQYSNDQIFFMSFARPWCETYRYPLSQTRSPPKFSINGALTNLEEFSDTFHCSEDSKMNGGNKRCILW